MGRVNNTIDQFGRQRVYNKHQFLRCTQRNGFKLTFDGHYDIEGKRLSYVAKPIADNDVSTQEFVLDKIRLFHQQMKYALDDLENRINERFKSTDKKIDIGNIYISKDLENDKKIRNLERWMENNEKKLINIDTRKTVHDGRFQILRGASGIGFVQTPNDQFNNVGKRLMNVAIPETSDDATTQQYVLTEIHKVRQELAQTINKIYQAIHESLISVDDRMVTFENKIKRYDAQEENTVKKIADLEKRMKQDMKILLGVERKADSMIAASKYSPSTPTFSPEAPSIYTPISKLKLISLSTPSTVKVKNQKNEYFRCQTAKQSITKFDVVIDLSDVPIYSPQEQSENLSSIVSQEGQRWDLSDEEWQTPRRSSAIFLQDSPPSFSHESFGHERQRWDLGEEEWQIPRRSSSIFLRDSPPHFSDASFSQGGQR
ncbi:unnamed protein product [Ceutorhynchus assimilis]|uniref:Uncharacterized protein n=1 Tax=Ceutorhynchus assimilis TaxID=467358 RepID=A0A9N9MEV5_9CUCU|nr:unnamed protein product [Ceutorhynchus assimilis]